MKKLIKKKVNLFGKEFSVFALVAIVMVGLASAALVPYLSNTITGGLEVTSPFIANIAAGHVAQDQVNGTDIDLGSIVGGESVEATVRLQVLSSMFSCSELQKYVDPPSAT
jgi:hypothetical protein